MIATYLELLIGIQQASSNYEQYLRTKKAVDSILVDQNDSRMSSMLVAARDLPPQTREPGPIILREDP
jgi:hypothetical protein